MLAAIVLGIAGTNGTYALLSASRPIPLVPASGSATATIVAGTANLAVTGTPPPTLNLYPGETRTAEMVVTTSGTVPLALASTSITGTAATTFSASVAGGPCVNGAPPVATGPLGITVTATSPATVCVRLGLAVDAPATAVGSTGTIVITLTGSQI